jgi:hypothetical protein
MPSFNRSAMTHACGAFRSAREHQRVAALRALQDSDWIVEEEALRPEHGRRWMVNPRVHELYTEERDRHIARRAAVKRAIKGEG